MKKLNTQIIKLLEKYLEKYPKEVEKFKILKKQLKNNENIGDRKNFNGHLTASASILDEKNKKILLIKNINLSKWLVPGGHYEKGDIDLLDTSKRELIEETSIKNFIIHDWHKVNHLMPLNIDTHYIPENKKKGELEHHHHDFNYLFLADSNQKLNLQEDEVNGLKWVNIFNDEIQNIHAIEKIKKLISE